jgi:peroxiredoxin (alkyl hydroperoxide reductase subunit C)
MSVLVTKEAPLFTATAVMPDDTFKDDFALADLRGKYVTLIFYPQDFSFVCPTELLATDHKVDQFRERDCEVLGISVDSHFTHQAWRRTPIEEGGIGPIRFPLVADVSQQITQDYGVLADDFVALRATFLLDRQGVVRHQLVNDPNVGRNMEDTLRVLDALRHIETHGRMCPANWEEGQESIEGTPAGITKYLKQFRVKL